MAHGGQTPTRMFAAICPKATMTPDEVTTNAAAPLGWWAISGDALLAMLRRAHDGEDPDLIYAEEYANSDHEAVPGA